MYIPAPDVIHCTVDPPLPWFTHLFMSLSVLNIGQINQRSLVNVSLFTLLLKHLCNTQIHTSKFNLFYLVFHFWTIWKKNKKLNI